MGRGEGTAAGVSPALRRLLRDDEELLWHYRPPRGLYFRGRVVSTVLVGLIVVTVFYGMFVAVPVLLELDGVIEPVLGVSAPVAVTLGWVAVQAVWFVAVMLSNYGAYGRIEFAATDQRAVQLGGALGLDASAVDWDDVQDVEVGTGPLDGVFGTGTLRFSRAGRASPHERSLEGDDDGTAFAGVRFRSVRDPYAVIDRLEDGRRAR